MARDRVDVVVDFRGKDVAHLLQDEFLLADSCTKTAMEQTARQRSNLERAFEVGKRTPNGLREHVRIRAIGPFNRILIDLFGRHRNTLLNREVVQQSAPRAISNRDPILELLPILDRVDVDDRSRIGAGLWLTTGLGMQFREGCSRRESATPVFDSDIIERLRFPSDDDTISPIDPDPEMSADCTQLHDPHRSIS